jgi:hypothetical protein
MIHDSAADDCRNCRENHDAELPCDVHVLSHPSLSLSPCMPHCFKSAFSIICRWLSKEKSSALPESGDAGLP